MIKRTVYVGNPSYLHLHDKQLKVLNPDNQEELGSIPVEDIGILLLDNYQVTLTHGIMQALQDNNAAIISCNSRHLPEGLMLPLDGHYVQSERFRVQIEASDPLKKQLWQQTVIAKIKNQSAMLLLADKENKQLEALLPRVKSGDPDNTEGRAAAVYWKLIFDDAGFVRERFGTEPNAHLNYCYAILRAMVARALTASGLLPTLGIFHRNRYNAYCLADDIMEPYRPFCDRLVYELWKNGEITGNEISKEQKAQLLSIATADVLVDGKKSPLMVALSRTTNTLYECFEGSRRKIVYPEFYDQ